MATIDHEHNHFKLNSTWMSEAKKMGYDDLFQYDNIAGTKVSQPGRTFVEAKNYQLGLEQGPRYGYSKATMQYLQKQVNRMPWVIRAEIGVLY